MNKIDFTKINLIPRCLASDLGEEHREAFTEAFYKVAPGELDDLDTPQPWGCPWYWSGDVWLEGYTIEEMAEAHFREHEKEILEILAAEAAESE